MGQETSERRKKPFQLARGIGKPPRRSDNATQQTTVLLDRAVCWAGSTNTQPFGSTVAHLESEGPVCQIACRSAADEEATMARGSKIFRPDDVSESNASSYPEPFREGQRKRYTRRLGDHAGLKNYGVNLVRVLPGGQSSARHTHSKQDEFVYVVEGEFVLVTDAGRETVGPGTCIGFPAGTGDGHHFLNLTQKDAIFLVIGDRTAGDDVTYPDIDLELKAGPDGVRGFRRKDGTPYPRAAPD